MIKNNLNKKPKNSKKKKKKIRSKTNIRNRNMKKNVKYVKKVVVLLATRSYILWRITVCLFSIF